MIYFFLHDHTVKSLKVLHSVFSWRDIALSLMNLNYSVIIFYLFVSSGIARVTVLGEGQVASGEGILGNGVVKGGLRGGDRPPPRPMVFKTIRKV